MSAMSQLLKGLGKAAGRSAEAWHGSPFRFSQFADEAIGSGEGNQVRGVGHYLATLRAEAEKYKQPRDTFLFDDDIVNTRNRPGGGWISRWYGDSADAIEDRDIAERLWLDTLGPSYRRLTSWGKREVTPEINDEAYDVAHSWVDRRFTEAEKRADDVKGRLSFDMQYPKRDRKEFDWWSQEEPRALKRMEDMLLARRMTPNPGHLYRVQTDVNPTKLLNLNEPFAGQTRPVRDMLRGVMDEIPMSSSAADVYEQPGSALLTGMEKSMGSFNARDRLMGLGFEGTKYTPYGGAQSRGEHIIVFDPRRIRILEMLAAAGVVGAAEELARLQSQQAQTTNPEQA